MLRRFTLLILLLATAFSCGKDGLNLDDTSTKAYVGLKPQPRQEINRQVLNLLDEHQKSGQFR